MGTQQEQTTTRTLPGMGNQEAGARNILEELMGATGQLGDLTDLAQGNFSLSPQDISLLQEIQRLSGDSARLEMGRNLDFASSDLEEQLLARGVEGSSIEGLQQGLLNTEALHGLNQSSIQGQINTADQMRQHVFDKAGTQLNANQIILNRILQGAGTLGEMGLQERLAQGSETTTMKQSGAGAIAGQLGQLGGLALSAFNPVGAAATALPGVVEGMQGPSVQGQPIG